MSQSDIYTILCVVDKGDVSFPVEINKNKILGLLKKEIIKEKPSYANIDPDSLDLYLVDIPDAQKAELKASVETQVLDSPQLPSRSLVDIFPDGPQPHTVHFIVKASRKRPSSDDSEQPTKRRRRPSPPLAQTENVILRKSTVEALYEKLNLYRFVLVRGTPASGKSTLAQLLLQHIREKEPDVEPIVISRWVESDANWTSRLGDQYDPNVPSTIVIDEAQLTYWDGPFWTNFLKSFEKTSTSRIILFASYGSPNRMLSIGGTPIVVAHERRVSLRPVDHQDGIGAVGLFLLREEFDEMVEKLYPAAYFEADFIDYVFRITAGHTGSVKDLLEVVQADGLYRQLQRDNVKYSLEMFHSQFPIWKLYKGLDSASIFRRGLPYDGDLRNLHIARVFRAVLRYNHVTDETMESKEDKDALKKCFKHGWLHATTDDSGKLVYIFTTYLHQWFIEHFLGTDGFTARPVITEQDLFSFAIKVIELFSPLQLSSTRKIIGASNTQRPPEAQFQDEFYRCCHTYSNGSLISFPEFGGARGKVDFYIPLKQWGVELLRDGDRLESHSSRFTGPGAYAEMKFQDYIILDFRTKSPVKPHPGIPRLYHVVLAENYRRVHIIEGSTLKELKAFELLNPI